MSRDVLVDGNPATSGHGAAGHSKSPAVLKLVDDVAGVQQRRLVYPVSDVFFRIRRAGAGGNPKFENLFKHHPWLYGFRSKAIHRAVNIVGKHEPAVGIKHARSEEHTSELQSLRH